MITGVKDWGVAVNCGDWSQTRVPLPRRGIESWLKELKSKVGCGWLLPFELFIGILFIVY